jgi:hypothetical protein
MARYIDEKEIIKALTDAEFQQWVRLARQIEDATTKIYFARKALRDMRVRVRRRIQKVTP